MNALKRWLNSDVGYSFRQSPTAMVAAGIAFICLFCSVFAGWVAPTNPFDLATLELSDARLPPAWMEGGTTKFLLGTDDQGRDILSALIYGSRISLVVGLASVVLSVVVGVGLGLPDLPGHQAVVGGQPQVALPGFVGCAVDSGAPEWG